MYFQTRHERAFGTYPLTGQELEASLEAALDIGYRAIDTAQMYANESDIGQVLSRCSIPRDELLITSKVPTSQFDESSFIPSVKNSLDQLKLEKLDVLLVHWPPGDEDVRPSLGWLQQAQQQGLAQHIGISNYNSHQMRIAKDFCDSPLVTNQVEFHPLIDQSSLLRTSADTGIPLASYCSVARGKVFDYPLFSELANAYGVTPAQVVLRWILQQGVSINAMSTKRENLEILVVDAIWLGLVAKKFYADQLGSLMRQDIKALPAVAFYLLFAVGLVILAVRPEQTDTALLPAALYGALIGFIAYGTYNMTNYATLNDWPIKMTLVDWPWGTGISALAAAVGAYVKSIIA